MRGGTEEAVSKLKLEGLVPEVAETVRPFFERLLAVEGPSIEGIYLLGSAAAGDYHGPGTELNSLLVVDQMDLDLVGSVGVIGQEFAGTGLTAPIIMTEPYIRRSTDVFPVEFLNMKSSYVQIYGDKDVLADLTIERDHLRMQVERELKARLVGLRTAFISAAAGDALVPYLVQSVAGYYPLFKALLHLKEHEIPRKELEILEALQEAFGVSTEAFRRVQTLAWGGTIAEEIDPIDLFRDFYDTIRAYSELADGLGE